jgi:hypothetical protein
MKSEIPNPSAIRPASGSSLADASRRADRTLGVAMELLADVAGNDEMVDGLFDSAHRLAGLLGAALRDGVAR